MSFDLPKFEEHPYLSRKAYQDFADADIVHIEWAVFWYNWNWSIRAISMDSLE